MGWDAQDPGCSQLLGGDEMSVRTRDRQMGDDIPQKMGDDIPQQMRFDIRDRWVMIYATTFTELWLKEDPDLQQVTYVLTYILHYGQVFHSWL